MWGRYAVDHRLEYRSEVNEVTDRPPNVLRNSGHLGIESNARTISEKAIVHTASVDRACWRVALQSAGKLRRGLLPIDRNGAGFGEVVSCSDWDDTELDSSLAPQYAVDDFMDAAVSAGDHYSLGARHHRVENPGLEIAGRLALKDVMVNA